MAAEADPIGQNPESQCATLCSLKHGFRESPSEVADNNDWAATRWRLCYSKNRCLSYSCRSDVVILMVAVWFNV